MINEFSLIITLICVYFFVLIFYYLFKNTGLYVWTAIATILANIEVVALVYAFGIRQTLGNILFASTFLVTDILSETSDKKSANLAVNIGAATSISFIIISQIWQLYIPDKNDFALQHIKCLFSSTPRLIFASLSVYIIVQKFDVWLYHKLWDLTKKTSGKSDNFLWLRNNFATLTSQLLNAVLYTLAAFYGVYETKIICEIIFSSYVVSIFTSLLDTPILYLARMIYKKDNPKPISKP